MAKRSPLFKKPTRKKPLKGLPQEDSYGLQFAIKARMLTDKEIENCRLGILFISGYYLCIIHKGIKRQVTEIFPGRRDQLLINHLLDIEDEIPF